MTDQPRSPEYLIDDIMPSREVHLIGGPSGGGKSSWIFQFLKQWSAGQPIYGHASHPVPYAYISTDRGKASILRTLKRLRIDPDTIPYLSTVSKELRSVDAIVALIVARQPEVRLLIIEGMTGLMPTAKEKSSDGGFAHASSWLVHLNNLCEKHDLTIIAVVHSPKSKEDARYLSPRDRVMGSSAWAAYTETLFLIEPVHVDTPELRSLIIISRNARQEVHHLQFNDHGQLVEASEELDNLMVELFIGALTPDQSFTAKEFSDYMKGKNLSQSTATRRLREMLEAGTVKRTQHGQYARVVPS